MSFEPLSNAIQSADTKAERLRRLLAALPACFAPDLPEITGMSNFLALLHETMGNLWSGFYFVRDRAAPEPDLFLGLFQGSAACEVIRYGKGVCGTSLKEGKILIVQDVEDFPGHIACSSLSRSEIVLPLFDDGGKAFAVLDLDSSEKGFYDETDRRILGEIVRSLAPYAARLRRALFP